MLASIPLTDFEQSPVIHFTYTDPFDNQRAGIAIRHRGRFFAFRNLCPHWSTPLGDAGDDIVDPATGELICNTHGARFEPTTGDCVIGPCMGQSLQQLDVQVDDDRVVIQRAGVQF